jgi:uncharacterized damage-inducible protein DinB
VVSITDGLAKQDYDARRGSAMNPDRLLHDIVGRALSGEGAHAGTANAVDGLEWKIAAMQPSGAPHSIYQLLAHVSYWQNWVLQWLDGKDPAIPRHAAGSWPRDAGPGSRKEWARAVREFRMGLDQLEKRGREVDLLGTIGKTSRLRMLHTIASHNSYHIGQIVLMRQLLGKWPPRSGGLTW